MAVGTHPQPEELLQFIRGQLSDAEAERIVQHLQDCAECERFLAQAPPDSFIGKVRQGLSEHSHPTDELTSGTTPSSANNPTANAPATQPDFELPDDLIHHERYQFLGKLGGGGMGIVYLAEHKLMRRKVAIKLIPPSLASNPTAVERFRHEIVACAKLEHQNIVRAYSAERFGPHILFEMEYVDGQDLSEVVKQKGPLLERYAVNYIKQAAIGLAEAHQHQLVHRDIKPRNIMLTRSGQIKVADFGLAKFQYETGQDSDQSSLTGDDKMMGTPDYIAPEQSRNAKTADIRADIYSLGCTFYYLLIGQPPYSGNSMMEVIFAHTEKPVPDVRQIRPSVSAPVAELIRTMMAKLPGDRPQTPLAIVEKLNEIERNWSLGEGAQSRMIADPQPDPFAGIDEDDTEPDLISKTNSSGSKRSWLIPSMAATVMLLVAIFAAFASGVIRLRTPQGTIELIGYERDIEVLIDGETMQLSWAEGKQKAELKVAAGKPHKLELKRDGAILRSESVELVEHGKRVFEAKLVAVKPNPKTNQPPDPVAPPVLKAPPSLVKRFPCELPLRSQSEWKIVGDELWQTSITGRDTILFGDPAWTDYDFSADVMLYDGTGGGAALRFRIEENDNYLHYTLGAFKNDWHMVGTYINSALQRPWLAASRNSIKPNAWNSVKVSVRGNEGMIYRDGVKVFDFDASTHANGRVGLSTWDNCYKFRNIKVTDPNGKILLEGLPELPSFAEDGPSQLVGYRPYEPQGKWRVEGDKLIQGSDSAVELLVFGDEKYADLDYSLELRRVKGAEQATLFFNYKDRNNFTYLSLGSYSNTYHEIVPVIQDEFRFNNAVSVAAALENDKWYQCDIRIRGKKASVLLDKQPLLEIELENPILGRIGLSTRWSSYEFRNLTVKDPAGKTLLEGLPQADFIADRQPAEKLNRFPVERIEFDQAEWKVEGNELLQRSKYSVEALLFDESPPAEFDFSAEMMKLSGVHAGGLVFNFQDTQNYEWLAIGSHHNTLTTFGKLTNGVESFPEGGSVEATIEPNKWYKVQLKVRTDRVTGWVDGQQIVSLPLAQVSRGKIGVWTFRSQYKFRQLQLTTPEGKLLASGPSRVKARPTPPANRFPYQMATPDSPNLYSHWKIEGDELVQTSTTARQWMYFGDPTWTDYDFGLDFKRTQGTEGLGLAVRSPDVQNGYWVSMAAYANTWQYPVLFKNGLMTELDNGREAAIIDNQWYRLEVKVRGEKATVFLDRQQIFEFPVSEFPSGRVGLFTFDSIYRVKNLTVTDPKGQVLLRGLPELPAQDCSFPVTKVDYLPTEWEIENGTLIQKKVGGHGALVFGDKNWSEYVIETEVQMQDKGAGHGYGVYYRFQDYNNNYLFNPGCLGGDWLAVQSWEPGPDPLIPKAGEPALMMTPYKLVLNRWYRVKLVVKRDTCEILVDDAKIGSFPANLHPNGQVGLGAWQGVYAFRNIRVSDLNGNLQLSGLPNLKEVKVDDRWLHR